jgi:hypothetical protein
MKKFGFLILALPFIVAASTAAYAGDQQGEKQGEGTIQGCLSDGASDGWYVLTKRKGDETKEIQVSGDATFEAHIGHEVQLTGEWKEAGDGSKHFQATGMKHIAETCSS